MSRQQNGSKAHVPDDGIDMFGRSVVTGNEKAWSSDPPMSGVLSSLFVDLAKSALQVGNQMPWSLLDSFM